MQIRRHDDVKRSWIEHESRGRRVHEQRLERDVWVSGRHLANDSVPENARMEARVRLSDARNTACWACSSELEGIPRGTLDRGPRVHRGLQRELRWLAAVREAADAGVLAFGVFPDNDEVDLLRRPVCQ